MTDQPQADRFTLPCDIPDRSVSPREGGDLSQQGATQDAGRFPPSRELTNNETARGYVMAHPAGRGWVPLEPTPIPSRMREGSEACQAAGEASRSGEGQALTGGQKPGPAPIFDPRRQAQFCESLSHNGNVRLACRACAISPQTAYRARRASPAFARLWDAALLIARRHAEELLADRALSGVEEAVFYHGEVIATRRRYDSRLLLAHLARLDAAAERAGDGGISEHGFDDALGALTRGEPYPPPAPAPAPPPPEHVQEVIREDEDDDSYCPEMEEHCLACGAEAGEYCRASRFTPEQLEDRADPAHWIDGEYLDPFEREMRALEEELEEEPVEEGEGEGGQSAPTEEPEEDSRENIQDPVPGVPGSPAAPEPRPGLRVISFAPDFPV